MPRALFMIIIWFCVNSIITAQDKAGNLPSTPPNNSEQNNYSDSIAYKPRQVDKKKNKKEQNEEKKLESGKPTDSEKGTAAKIEIEKKPIKIPISVFDKNGKPVHDLKQSDFRLFIDGKEETFSNLEIVREPLNILLILDISPSSIDKLKDLQNFATQFVASLNSEDKIQILGFNEKLIILTGLTNDHQILNEAIARLKIVGGSGTALYQTVQYIEQKSLRLAKGLETIVLLTDGVDTTSNLANYESSLIEAEKNDAVVFSFFLDTSGANTPGGNSPFQPGILNNLPNTVTKEDYERGKNYLTDLSTLSGGKFFKQKNVGQLKKNDFENILDFIKPQYLIDLTDNGSPGERKQIKVRVNRPDLVVQSKASYIIDGK